MPVHFPSESGLPAEASHGRSNGRALGSVRLGFPLRDANTGAGQDFTGLGAAIQLRLRVAVGLQALQRCSGLFNRRARGSTVATHHFASVVKLLSSSASNGEFAGGSPAGCTNYGHVVKPE